MIQVGLFELIDAFQRILQQTGKDHTVEMVSDEISVKDKIAQIVEILETKASITFLELFSDNSDRHEVIITFLAILEMVRLALIRIIQNVKTGIIRIIYI